MIDLHTHILPGLDDGADSTEEALQMAAIAVGAGISAVVATPHVISGLYDNPPELIGEAVDALNCRLAENNIALSVLPGAEYRLEPDLSRRLTEGRLTTVNDTGRYLLLELPSGLVPPYTESLLYELQLQGVTPILAHPERNAELGRDAKVLYHLAQHGVLGQVTAGSILGRFGSAARRAALTMLDIGAAQVVASDAHSCRNRTPDVTPAVREIEARWGAAFARDVFSVRPRRLIAGEHLDSLEPVSPAPPAGLLARLLRPFSR